MARVYRAGNKALSVDLGGISKFVCNCRLEFFVKKANNIITLVLNKENAKKRRNLARKYPNQQVPSSTTPSPSNLT